MPKIKKRTKAKMHLRSPEELCWICYYIDRMVTAEETKIDNAYDMVLEVYEQAIKHQKAGNREEFLRLMDEYKERKKPFEGTWFTNTINSNGQIDIDGEYKKIRSSDLRKYLLFGEEEWCRANKEAPLGENMLVADLKSLGIITPLRQKTHRPVDMFGKRTTEQAIKGVSEYSVSKMRFFAEGKGRE